MRYVVGLGGNLGEVAAAFRRAARALDETDGIVVESCSSLYLTDPVGPDQPRYHNAAMMVDVAVDPRALLRRCLEIERGAGRHRAEEARWGPRTLDLDLLLAEDLVCRGRELELPHPRLCERAFALAPAADVAPRWVHPLCGCVVAELAAAAVAAGHAVAAVGGWWGGDASIQ